MKKWTARYLNFPRKFDGKTQKNMKKKLQKYQQIDIAVLGGSLFSNMQKYTKKQEKYVNKWYFSEPPNTASDPKHEKSVIFGDFSLKNR